MGNAYAIERNESCQAPRAGEFFNPLSPEALSDFKALEFPSSYPGNAVLFLEKQTPSSILVLLEGLVKLSIHSSDGKRLILRIAKPGEFLGLTSAFSGSSYEITAETLFPCRIASLRRQDFMGFLRRHPAAYQGVAHELSLDYNRACERLRAVGLPCSAQAKLARLLLEWSAGDQQTGCGTRLKLPLTHEEIGECIGSSRETVTRALNDFKQRQLVELHGATLKIPNREALEHYALRGRRRGFISHPAKSTVSARAAAWIGSSRSSDLTLGRKIEQLKNGQVERLWKSL